MPFQLIHANRKESIQPGNVVVIETLDKPTQTQVVRTTIWLSTEKGAVRRRDHAPDKRIEPKRRKTINLGFEEKLIITPLIDSTTRTLPPYDEVV